MRRIRTVRTPIGTLWTTQPKRPVLLPATLAVLTALAIATAGRGAPPRGAWPATVFSWTDGDTVVLATPSAMERTRLIGIDAPEASPSDRAHSQARRLGVPVWEVVRLGQQARDHAQKLAPPNGQVYIETDVQTRDRYGRLLAYLWLPDGRLLQEELLRAGWADLLTIPPNVKYTERLRKAWREARDVGRGMWHNR